jgi:hypothetical protein
MNEILWRCEECDFESTDGNFADAHSLTYDHHPYPVYEIDLPEMGPYGVRYESRFTCSDCTFTTEDEQRASDHHHAMTDQADRG